MLQHNEGARVVTKPDREGDTIVKRFRFRVLGPIQVVDELDEVIDVGAPAQRLVLGQLLFHPNRVVSTDALVDAVWGDDPPPTARRSHRHTSPGSARRSAGRAGRSSRSRPAMC